MCGGAATVQRRAALQDLPRCPPSRSRGLRRTPAIYYAITGTLAFDGATLAAIALQVTHHTPPPASQRVPGIPAGADTAVMTALAKDPRQRFATAGAFADAFSAALAAARRDGGRAPEPAELAEQRRHDLPASTPVT